MFSDMSINKKKAQLIFTSHDLSTMNSEVFRRDEIWFVAKGNAQNSQLYSLVEFKMRRASLFVKMPNLINSILKVSMVQIHTSEEL